MWRLEAFAKSKNDGSVIFSYPAKTYADRLAADEALFRLGESLPKNSYIAGHLSHPTYGLFFLDPSMWDTILNSRKWNF